MGYSVLQKWSKKSVSSAPLTGSKGMKVFTVAGTGATVVTEETAIGAVDSVSGLTVPIVGTSYSSTATWLCCNDVTVNTLSLNLVEVVCSFSYGQFFPPTTPLSEPEVIQWGQSTITEETDHDLDGLPTLNVCGSVMTGAKQTFFMDTLSITKNISAFDLSVARTYRNTVNNASLTIYTAGTGVAIPAGFMRCVSILPTRPYKVADAYVPICATFEIADSNALANPFQWRFVNAGYEAYSKETGSNPPADSIPIKGRIVHRESGVAVSHIVRLDSNGVPMERSTPETYAIKRQQGQQTSTAFYTSPLASGIISRMTMAPDTSTSTDAVYLFYRKCKAANFSTLFSTLGIT